MDFVDRVQRQQARLFDEVLPAFIDRFYAGDGHELLFELVDAAARRDLSAVAGLTAPGDAALERAHFVRIQCPIALWPDELESGGAWLAQYAHDGQAFRQVLVQPSAFAAQGWSGDRLDDELFWALFAGYLQYFEATARAPSSATRAEARRRDRAARGWRAAKWSALVAVVVGCVAVAGLTATRAAPSPREGSSGAKSADLEAAKQAEARRAAELSRRVREAVARRLSPEAALAAVGPQALLPTDPFLAHLELVADPDVPGARAPSADAVLTLLWLRPGSFSPLRLTGMSWDADGGVRAVDVSDANFLVPVGSTAGAPDR